MKKFSVVLSALLLVAGIMSSTFAADSKAKTSTAAPVANGGNTYKMAVSLDPISLLVGLAFGGIWLNGSFETQLFDNVSIQIDGRYYSWGTKTVLGNYTYIGVNAKARYYLNQFIPVFPTVDKGITGWYAGAGLNIDIDSYTYETTYGTDTWGWNGTGTFFGPSIEFGYKYMTPWLKGLFIEPYLGYTLNMGSWKYTYTKNGSTVTDLGTGVSAISPLSSGGLGYGGRIGFAF